MTLADDNYARLDEPDAQAPAARAARGKAARRAVPRESHATFDAPSDRADPVSLLRQQGETRLAELLPIRYGRMLASPLAYFRGAALVMASDLATTPATGLISQVCGDAHLSNFGIFASPERRLIFDINDFDETQPGPWEWDVKRLAASLEIAGRGSDFSAAQRRRVLTEAVRHYRLTMRTLAGLGNLEVWYSHDEVDELADRYKALLSKRELALAGVDLSAADEPDVADDEPKELSKLVADTSGKLEIVGAPPLIVPVADLPEPEVTMAELSHIVTGYRQTLEHDRSYLISQFDIADIARKVTGIGSVGMRCWMVVLTGRDSSDRLFLQIKEAQQSVLGDFAGPSPFGNQGQRVVAGQRLMQAASDMFLGWHRSPTADYYLRQLRDWKFTLPAGQMRPATLRAYAALCGRTLARAHARSGDRIAIGAYLGRSAAFDAAVADFANLYADRNERDYAGLKAAVKSGQLAAERSV